jgi:hypothetical protein
MALLFFDGFDHYGDGAGVGSLSTGLAKWGASTGGSAPAVTNSLARTGTCSLRSAGAADVNTKPLPASGGAVVGMAFRQSVIQATDIFQVKEGASTVHMAVAITASGTLQVKRGSTVLATGTKVIAVNSWYYLELLTVIHDTTGSYELRVDGLMELSATGTDTRNAGTTGQWDRIQVMGTFSTLQYLDDLYVCDTSGSAPTNTFLGPVKIETLFPQTDAVSAGSNAGLTPSTGTDHGALVDEPVPNTTDYNSSPTVGLKDTYQYPAMTLTGVILGIQTNLFCQKSDATARTVCAVVRSGGTDYDGASVSPLTTWGYLSEVRALNPATSAPWTTTEIAALEAGMKVTA